MTTREPAVKRDVTIETKTVVTITQDELIHILAAHFARQPTTKALGTGDVPIGNFQLRDYSGDYVIGDFQLSWTTTETR